MPSTSGNPTWSAERRRTWWRTPATPCSCRSGSAPRTSCPGCYARCTAPIGRKCATRWSSPTGGSISTSRRVSSRHRGRPPRRASRSRPRTRSFRPGRGLRRREGPPNNRRGGAHHEEDRHWLRGSSDHDALVWAGVGLVACIRRARLLEREQLPWRLRLRRRRLLERQRCPRRLRLWWRGVLERQRWPRRLRLRWRGLVERRGWPRRLRLRRRQRCQPHVCDGRDLRDAACRLRHTHRPGRDLLSVWQYVVPAVLRRERRLLSRGAHALMPCAT